jgi:hypothetical protein
MAELSELTRQLETLRLGRSICQAAICAGMADSEFRHFARQGAGGHLPAHYKETRLLVDAASLA